MPNRLPEWELKIRMSELRLLCAILFIDEADPFKGQGVRPNNLIAHKRELWYGKPIIREDVVAIRGGLGNHDCARSANFVGLLCVSTRHHNLPFNLFSHVRKRLAYELDPDSGGQSLSRSSLDKASPDLKAERRVFALHSFRFEFLVIFLVLVEAIDAEMRNLGWSFSLAL
ncbi:MAG: hypothetical protein Q9164_001504 [Protoblastenia rupestris]